VRPRQAIAPFALLASAAVGCARPAPAPVSAAESPPAGPASSGGALGDAAIAHVVTTANAIDVEMARLALGRAEAPEALAFARTMIADHDAVNGRASALVARLSLVPEDNPVSASLREDAEGIMERLRALRGPTFDRAYLSREIAYHEAVVDAIEGVLIPGASNDDLRRLLVDVLPAFEAHLEAARHARAAVGPSPPAG